MRIGGKKGLKQRPEYFRLDATHPLARGLVFAGLGYMGSQKSARYHDSCAELRGIGAANHGTLTNMDPPSDHVWVPELGRWATDYDGTDDFVSTGNNVDISGSTSRSISLWMNASTFGSERLPLAYHGGAGVGLLWLLGISLAAEGRKAGIYGYASDLLGSTTLSTGAWYNITATYDGTTRKIFVNGVQDGLDAPSLNTTNSAFTIGKYLLSSEWGTGYFSGLIADALIHNRALSPSEISRLADRSDPMLGGLILPPRRRLWAAVSVTTRGRILGCGTGHILGA